MNLNHFTYNGHSTADYGLLVSGITAFNAPARKVEYFSVPGRNGDVAIEMGGYENIIIAYQVSIIDNTLANARNIANWLLSSSGYMKLTDTYDPSVYRMAVYSNSIDYAMSMLYRFGSCTIEFNCKPQRFLTSGETTTTITSSTYSLNNPTLMPARPLLRAYGTGTVTINGTVITINSVNSYVDIDCESQQAYKGSVNCNNDITVTDFPVLVAGNNSIALSGVTSLAVTPRWWQL